MRSIRNKYSAEFKAKLVSEVLKEDKKNPRIILNFIL